jgi:hypothetical protein
MRAREHGLVLLAGLVLAAIWTWPLLGRAATHFPHDPRFTEPFGSDMHIWMWDYWWARVSLEELWSPFHCPLIFHPDGHSLALHTHAWLLGLVSVPFQWIGGLPFALNAVLLLQFGTAFAATWALVRALGAGRVPAVFAAFAWAFSPYFVQKSLEHVVLSATPWPPLALLFVLRWSNAEGRREAVLAALATGLVLGLSLLTSLITFPYLLLVTALTAVLAPGGPDGARPSRRGLLSLPAAAAALLALGLLAAPWALELTRSAGELASASSREQLHHPHLADFLVPSGLHPLHEGLGAGAPRPDEPWVGRRNENSGLYVGLAVLTAALVGCITSRSARRWALVALPLFLLAWDPGPEPEGWLSSLYRRGELLQVFRVPARAWPFALLPICVAAALGMDLVRRVGPRPLGALLLVMLPYDWWIGPYPLAEARIPEAARALALAPGEGAVAVIPFAPGSNAAMSWQTVHGKPVLSSYVARSEPAHFEEWARVAPDLFHLTVGAAVPPPERLALDLELLDVEHVLVPTAGLATPELVTDVLDGMEGWGRAGTRDDVAWWYRLDVLEDSEPMLERARATGTR